MHKIGTIEGDVIVGKQIGKSIGFPTANVIFSEEDSKNLNLETGVFATLVKGNNIYDVEMGISCISKFKDGRHLIETHVIGLHKSTKLDGYPLTMAFMEKVREEELFSNKNDLLEQIPKDIESVTEYFQNRKTCFDCNRCYEQDYGYSNYTVEGSDIGCYANHFEEYDSHGGDKLKRASNDPAENCKDFEAGGSWQLDCDGEEPRPSDEQFKMWSRKSKINQIIEDEDEKEN